MRLPVAAAFAVAVCAAAALGAAAGRDGGANVAPPLSMAGAGQPRLALVLPGGAAAVLEGSRFRIADAAGRVLIDRPALASDRERLELEALEMTRADPAALRL